MDTHIPQEVQRSLESTLADLAVAEPVDLEAVTAAACWAYANLDPAARASILTHFCRARFVDARAQHLDRPWRILRWFLSRFRTARARR